MNRSPRGYLIAEALVAGAFVAVALGIAFSQIASARQEVSYSARHVSASSLARSKATEIAATSPLVPTALGAFADVDAVNYPGVQMRFSVADAGLNGNSTPNITAALFEILVEVRVPTRDGFDTVSYRTMQKD